MVPCLKCSPWAQAAHKAVYFHPHFFLYVQMSLHLTIANAIELIEYTDDVALVGLLQETDLCDEASYLAHMKALETCSSVIIAN